MDQRRPLSAPVVLAVESATAIPSVALVRGDEVLAEARPAQPGHHAETLLPLIAGVLSEAGLREPAIDAFGVSIGPGSFTSLRVGLATVKGLAFGTARPIVAVGTLAALAWTHAAEARRAGVARYCVPLLDARRGELYAGAYALGEDGPRELLAPGLFSPADLAVRLPAECVVVGEGVTLYGGELRELCGEGCRVLEGACGPPAAVAVAALTVLGLRAGDEGATQELAPRYVRRAEAEVTRTAKRVEDGSD